MPTIVQQDAPVLRKIAKEVPLADIKGSKIQTLLIQMKEALAGEYDGVGLAAPQLGESLRIFIISELVFRQTKEEKELSAKSGIKKEPRAEHLVFINPKIISSSKDKRSMEEGCLSVRPFYGDVKRSSKVTVQAYDESGEKFERGASGLLSQIFQHEIDHLNGILFIDTAKNLHEMSPEDIEEDKKEARKQSKK